MSAPDPRVLANLERARILPASGRFILVNSATAQLSMYQDGQAQDSMKVVVGKTRHADARRWPAPSTM